MKKIRCKVCRTPFIPQKDALYLSAEKPAPLSALVSPPSRIYECFDCPKCGCQTAVNVRITPVEQEAPVAPPGEEETDG